ncbi:hypothetical protein GF327_10125 [Candidatus Woesearchaeota archaeon]|nr:hypothetical protein [Candidatus Woesearchaeota archaeon]
MINFFAYDLVVFLLPSFLMISFFIGFGLFFLTKIIKFENLNYFIFIILIILIAVKVKYIYPDEVNLDNIKYIMENNKSKEGYDRYL